MSDAVKQVADKYIAPERADHGYAVIFDTKTKTGDNCKITNYKSGGKIITNFVIAIGRPE